MATLLNPFIRALDANGDPVSGGQFAVFEAGTTTPVTTYSDSSLSTAQAQPLIANSAGEFAQSFVAAGIYKIRVSDADGVTLYENDYVRIADRPDDPVFFNELSDLEDSTEVFALNQVAFVMADASAYITVGSGATNFDVTNAGGSKLKRFWDVYDDPADLQSSFETSRGVGAEWRAGYYVFEELASGATTQDITNAAGVKLAYKDFTAVIDGVRFSKSKISGVATFRGQDDGDEARLYVEPNGDSGDPVVAAIKVFADDYTGDDRAAYRDVGMYIERTKGTYPNIGTAIINSKMGADHWGLFMETGLSVQDSAVIPIRAGYINHRAAGDYFDAKLWKAGISVTTGDYAVVGRDASDVIQGHIYQAASTGTTGSTRPTHTSGSASDGGVSWTFVEDLSVTNAGYEGYVLIGDEADKPVRGSQIQDNSIVAQFSQPAAFQNGTTLYFMGSSNSATAVSFGLDGGQNLRIASEIASKSVYIDAQNGTTNLRVTDELVQINDAAVQLARATVSDNSTTLDATAATVITLSNTAATTISAVSGRGGQVVYLVGSNANTTLQNNANLVTGTGGNLNIALNECYQFVFTSTSKMVRIL